MIPGNGYGDALTVDEQISKLGSYIQLFPDGVRKLSADELERKPANDKWSKKEIIGHLVDSALNNLKRFTDAQFSTLPYKVHSYQQDELVKVNKYQNLNVEHLLNLWQALNKHIIFVAKEIPRQKLDYPVDPQYENGELKTLGWLFTDYVAHMEHHFNQIIPTLLNRV